MLTTVMNLGRCFPDLFQAGPRSVGGGAEFWFWFSSFCRFSPAARRVRNRAKTKRKPDYTVKHEERAYRHQPDSISRVPIVSNKAPQ